MMDELPDGVLEMVAEAVHPSMLFAMSLLSSKYEHLVSSRVRRLAALRAQPFNISPRDILGSHASSQGFGIQLGSRLRNDQSRTPDDHMTVLCDALASGAMANVTRLDLSFNQIADAGMEAFASACASGALPALKTLALANNPASQEAKQAANNAIKNRK